MKKLYMSESNKKIFGVCGGIAQAYDIDSNVVRLAAVFLCIATGILPGVITYLVSWFIVPKDSERPQE